MTTCTSLLALKTPVCIKIPSFPVFALSSLSAPFHIPSKSPVCHCKTPVCLSPTVSHWFPYICPCHPLYGLYLLVQLTKIVFFMSSFYLNLYFIVCDNKVIESKKIKYPCFKQCLFFFLYLSEIINIYSFKNIRRMTLVFTARVFVHS